MLHNKIPMSNNHNRAWSIRALLTTICLCALPSIVGACKNKTDQASGLTLTRSAKAHPQPLDSAAVRIAQSVMRHFFDATREGSTTRDSLAGLTNCGDGSGGSYFPTTLLAGYSFLPFDMHGDTVVARASVVTVAEQDVDRRASGFIARQRVREDVLEWDVIPTEDEKHWVVCNGLGFGYLGADSATKWRPDGASYSTARALVDSIVKARAN